MNCFKYFLFRWSSTLLKCYQLIFNRKLCFILNLMVFSFQFDPEFAPHRLCNWEVPKNHCSTLVHRKGGKTKVVSNERGHLLPGIPRWILKFVFTIGLCWLALINKTYLCPNSRSKRIGEHRCASAHPTTAPKDQCIELNGIKDPVRPMELNDRQQSLILLFFISLGFILQTRRFNRSQSAASQSRKHRWEIFDSFTRTEWFIRRKAAKFSEFNRR